MKKIDPQLSRDQDRLVNTLLSNCHVIKVGLKIAKIGTVPRNFLFHCLRKYHRVIDRKVCYGWLCL